MTRPRIIVTRRLPESVEQLIAAEFDAELNASDSPTTSAIL